MRFSAGAHDLATRAGFSAGELADNVRDAPAALGGRRASCASRLDNASEAAVVRVS